MRIPDSRANLEATVSNRFQSSRLDRKCAECEEEQGQPKAADEDVLQRRAVDGSKAQVSGGVHSQIESLRGRGQPLPETTRAFFEPRFGVDFSDVRVHTGSQAAQLNRAINAQAFTHQRDIYLGEGKNDPVSNTGRRLLAHELTHVIQQTGNSPLQTTLQRAEELPQPDRDLRSPRFAGDPILEACLDDKARLGMGARGDSVSTIQQALSDLGRIPPSGVDGIYGPRTSDAVRQFKIDEQLTPSTFGDVGPKTMARLDELFENGGGVLPPCPVGPDDIVVGGNPGEVTTSALVGATPVSAALIPGVSCQLVRPQVGPFPPTRLADLSRAESARLVVKTSSTRQDEIDAAYIPFRPRSTIRNTAIIVPALTFGASVPEDREVRQGLTRVASTQRLSTPPSLVPGSTQNVAVNDQPLQPDPQQPPTRTIPGGLFRLTDYMHGTTEVILVERLGNVPARIAPLGDTILGPFLGLARAEFAARHPAMAVGTGWEKVVDEIGVLDDAVNRMGAAAGRAGTLTFDRSLRSVGALDESGRFDPNTRHIEIFQSAFSGGATRIGGSALSTFTICHEIAHAVSNDDPGLRAAFAQAAALDGTPARAGRLTGAVTERGNTSMEEYLVEAMALRATAPDVLLQLRPNIAAFLNRRF